MSLHCDGGLAVGLALQNGTRASCNDRVAALAMLAEGIHEDMMAAMLQCVQGAAAACAEVCMERMRALEVQMLLHIAEGGVEHGPKSTSSQIHKCLRCGFAAVDTNLWPGFSTHIGHRNADAEPNNDANSFGAASRNELQNGSDDAVVCHRIGTGDRLGVPSLSHNVSEARQISDDGCSTLDSGATLEAMYDGLSQALPLEGTCGAAGLLTKTNHGFSAQDLVSAHSPSAVLETCQSLDACASSEPTQLARSRDVSRSCAGPSTPGDEQVTNAGGPCTSVKQLCVDTVVTQNNHALLSKDDNLSNNGFAAVIADTVDDIGVATVTMCHAVGSNNEDTLSPINLGCGPSSKGMDMSFDGKSKSPLECAVSPAKSAKPKKRPPAATALANKDRWSDMLVEQDMEKYEVYNEEENKYSSEAEMSRGDQPMVSSTAPEVFKSLTGKEHTKRRSAMQQAMAWLDKNPDAKRNSCEDTNSKLAMSATPSSHDSTNSSKQSKRIMRS